MTPAEHSLRKHSLAVGKPPGSLAIPAGALPPRLTLIRYRRDRFDLRRDVPAEQLRELVQEDGVNWIDVTGIGSQEVLERLIADFDLPWLAIEDILHSPQRSKVEPYDDARFIVMRVVDQPGTVDMDQLSIFRRAHLVFTFQERPGDPFDSIRARLEHRESQLRQRGADYLVYRLVDSCVDSFFPEVERLAGAIEELEDEAFENPSSRMLQRLHGIRHDLRILERVCIPQRDAVAALARDEEGMFDRRTRPYLRDVLDHTTQLLELVHYYNAVVSDVGNLVIGSLDLRMNQAMRILAGVTVVFMPLTFVAGIYGMNFDNMPELSTRWGYFGVLGLMLVLGAALTLWLYRRGWLRSE